MMISKVELLKDEILEIIEEAQATLERYDRLCDESKECSDLLKKIKVK